MVSCLYRIGTGAVIVNSKDKILLGYRGPKARDQHYKWELLGGLMRDDDETPKDAIIREVEEEAGIKVRPLVIVGTNVNNVEVDGQVQRWVGITYLCEYVSGEPMVTSQERVLRHVWVTPQEALDDYKLTPMTRLQINQYLEFKAAISAL